MFTITHGPSDPPGCYIQMIKEYIFLHSGWVVKHQMFLAPHKQCSMVLKCYCNAASELSVHHILEPNKIMQLSNLKPKTCSKKQYFNWTDPLIASFYFLPLLGFTICCHNVGVTYVVVEICSRHLGYTSVAHNTFCRLGWIQHNILDLICQRIVPCSFTA